MVSYQINQLSEKMIENHSIEIQSVNDALNRGRIVLEEFQHNQHSPSLQTSSSSYPYQSFRSQGGSSSHQNPHSPSQFSSSISANEFK